MRTLPRLVVFPTELGWFGLLGEGRTIWRLLIGHTSAEKVRDAARRDDSLNGAQRNGTKNAAECLEADWFPEFRLRLQSYAHGIEVDFRDCDVLFGRLTPFQKRIYDATRRIGYGQTITYGQLAARAGRPGAARAVGNVMAANPVPIIVPCHRVVAAGGRWGGFSAPQGVSLKRRLLELEGGAPGKARLLNALQSAR